MENAIYYGGDVPCPSWFVRERKGWIDLVTKLLYLRWFFAGFLLSVSRRNFFSLNPISDSDDDHNDKTQKRLLHSTLKQRASAQKLTMSAKRSSYSTFFIRSHQPHKQSW